MCVCRSVHAVKSEKRPTFEKRPIFEKKPSSEQGPVSEKGPVSGKIHVWVWTLGMSL